MRIIGPGLPAVAAASPLEDAAAAGHAANAPAAAAGVPLQSAALQPALAALRAMPDFDQAKVDALRAALARGSVPFDAAKLAGLIERFHGGKP